MKRFLIFSGLVCWLQVLVAQQPPVAANDTFAINKNTTVTFPVLANDFDADGDPLSLGMPYTAAHGNATAANGLVQYTPVLNYTGTDTFSYAICDTTGLCDTALVYITITDVNNAPVAGIDTFSVPPNNATFLPVAGNDYDPDGDPLSITLVYGAQHGTTAVTNGTQVIYTPAAFYLGTDSFSYVICDNGGKCDTAVVFINVSGNNSPPVAGDDLVVFGDTVTVVAIDVLANDRDNENDSLFIVSAYAVDSSSILGSVLVDPATGKIIFERLPLACGSETFEYIVCDANACDTATLRITINCPDKVFLPKGFSPGSDGKNDELVFTGLEYFAPAKLKVFNRYGTLVYTSEDYQNDWRGTSLDGDKPLPDGTYFYVLELSDKTRYNNYLIINR